MKAGQFSVHVRDFLILKHLLLMLIITASGH